LCYFVLKPDSFAGWIVTSIAVAIASYQLLASIKFLMQRDPVTARKLLRTSLVFLPAIFLLVVVRWGLL
jgi:protoheme IX farnesyltransferase